MIVMKFGGTSNKDARAMTNVAAIIKAHRQKNPVVVISAIAQGTNMLEQAGISAEKGDTAHARKSIEELFDRHHAILDALIHDSSRKGELKKYMKTSFDELSSLIQGVAIVRECTPRTLDATRSPATTSIVRRLRPDRSHG